MAKMWKNNFPNSRTSYDDAEDVYMDPCRMDDYVCESACNNLRIFDDDNSMVQPLDVHDEHPLAYEEESSNYYEHGVWQENNYNPISKYASSLHLFESQPEYKNAEEEMGMYSQGSGESFFDVQPNELLSHQSGINNRQAITQNLFRPCPVDGLRKIEEVIAPHYRAIFKSIPCFNAIQSKVLDSVLNSDRPVVVAAPTGSGKTTIFELAIVWLLMQVEKESPGWSDFKIIYIAPVKALCSERLADWNEKFRSIGLSCSEVTGDMENTYHSVLRKHQIILTTPEKWDSLTRRWKDNRGLVQHVKLILIDEVHLLNEERRGPILEAVVSRMKTVQSSLQLEDKVQNLGPKGIRFLAVSATIPNIEDIARWLGSRSPNPPLHFSISEDERPVKLNKIVYGYESRLGWTPFRFDVQLNYRLKDVLMRHSDGKPSLVFCSTRKSVTQTSSVLVNDLVFKPPQKHKQQIDAACKNLIDKKIGATLANGVGAHHAGMHKNDRQIVENLFKSGVLPVLVSTSTLAMGVNLPAHLVVIKSTEQYIGSCYAEYSESAILQMMGRAGRPQFDTSATAVIMTKMSQKAKYERLIGGNQPIESTLHRNLAEHLNAEVVLQTITNLNLAMTWLRSTYLYVRAIKHPKAYNLPNDNQVETHLNNLCMKEMNALAKCGVVVMDGTNVTSTEAGKIMAKYCLSIESMGLFTEKIEDSMTMESLLHILSKCFEFGEYQLRVVEKRTLNELNKSIKFKVPGKVQSIQSKVFVLIQASLGGLQYQDIALQQESYKIMKVAQRVAKCLDEFIRSKFPNDYLSVLNSLQLAKAVGKSMWHDSNLVAKQFDGIGPKYAESLAAAGKTSFQAIKESNPRDLERIMGIGTAKGNNFVKLATHLPEYELDLKNFKVDIETVRLEVSCAIANVADLQQSKTAGARHTCLLILADRTNNKIIYSEKVSDVYLMKNTYKFATHYFLPDAEDGTTEIVARICSETWVGIDKMKSIKVECPRKISIDPKVPKEENVEVQKNAKGVTKPASKPKASQKKATKTAVAKPNVAAAPKKKKPSISTQTLEKYRMIPKYPAIKIKANNVNTSPKTNCHDSSELANVVKSAPENLEAAMKQAMDLNQVDGEFTPPSSPVQGSSTWSPSYSPLYSPSVSISAENLSPPKKKPCFVLNYPMPKLNFDIELESDDDEFEDGPFRNERLPEFISHKDLKLKKEHFPKFKRTLSPARDADTFVNTVFEALGSAVTPIISTYLHAGKFSTSGRSLTSNFSGFNFAFPKDHLSKPTKGTSRVLFPTF